jgi:hypothetical protein
MPEITYGSNSDTNSREIGEFYRRLRHEIAAQPQQLEGMVARSTAFVTARAGGELIGIARGVSDGLRGYFCECKLDPAYQGPAAVTRTDGRIEHDENGIAAEMARRVLQQLAEEGVERVDVMAWGTEVDFLKELGFRKNGGVVAMTLKLDEKTGPTLAIAKESIDTGVATTAN